MNWILPVTLSDEVAELVPLSQDHRDDLMAGSADGELWRLWYTTVPAPDGVALEIDRRLGLQAAGTMIPFAIIDKPSGKAVGMTTYMNIDGGQKRLEIGSTWYRKSVQRSGLNSRCKKMLLEHAFEELGAIAVEFRTHFFNQQSQKAIERLGAKLDGILRNHMVMKDGSYRDTCVYSIIKNEWPAVKTHLNFQINRPR